MHYKSRFACLVLGLLALNASAQWSWIDHNGRRIFSDRAPPIDIPAKDILTRPGRAMATPTAADANASTAATTPQAAASAAKPSGIEPVLAERKKKEDLAQKAQSVAEQEQRSKLRADNCERAKLAKKNMESGVRITRTNAAGEREVMDEAARATESQHIQSVIESECK